VTKFEKNKEGESAKEEKDEALRAEDIIPPFNAKPAETENKALEAENQRDTIPIFDLAEEIMAEHRKITSIKRKSPTIEPFKNTDSYRKKEDILNGDIAEAAEMDKIITEIVARDIEKLCRDEKIRF
jgi:hypothetical protein